MGIKKGKVEKEDNGMTEKCVRKGEGGRGENSGREGAENWEGR